jgi:hypothetical protein
VRWWRRPGFWQAVAGMTTAVAIGAIVVAAEFSATLIHRSAYYHRRFDTLDATVARLRRELKTVEQEKREAFAAGRQSGDLVFKRILTAADARSIPLAPPTAGAGAAGAHLDASGTLTLSALESGAVLQVRGLAIASPGSIYRAFWLDPRGRVLSVDEFIPGPDGRAAVLMALPDKQATRLVVILEPASSAKKPSGTAVLSGKIAS